jgi:hypothetical protein
VARSLERAWHATLAAVAHLEHASATRPMRRARPLRPAERQRLLELARELPAVWPAPTTPAAERTPRRRFVVQDVTRTRRATTMALAMRWPTQACTTRALPRPRRSCDARRTHPAVVARLRELARPQTDRHLALVRHPHGDTPGLGGPFTPSTVPWMRWQCARPRSGPAHPRAHADRPRGEGRYAARVAAARLHVAVGTMADWGHAGRLASRQAAPHPPRWSTRTPEVITAWRQPVRRRWARDASR